MNQFTAQAYNIDTELAPFFSDPSSFHAMQRATGAVISGSFALHFLLRETWAIGDLDVYIPTTAAKSCLDWLEANGYTTSAEDVSKVANHHSPGPYGGEGVIGTLQFERTTDGQTTKVDVILTSACVMQVILHFHSSECNQCCKDRPLIVVQPV